MGENISANPSEAFNAYYRPHVHKPNYYDCTVRETHAIVSYALDGEDSKTFRVNNVPGKHAECIVIEKLEGILEEKRKSTSPTKMKVKVYQNYSPCNTSGCCDALLKFKSDQKKGGTDVTMEVIFASLYNINRRYCVSNGCEHYKKFPVKAETDDENKKGLKGLKEKIGIRTFTKDDWNFVANVLSENNPDRLLAEKEEREPTRDDEDKLMKEDLADIIGAEEGIEADFGAFGVN